jgi:predicted transcriptional regulator
MTIHLMDEEVNILDAIEQGGQFSWFADRGAEKALLDDELIEKRDGVYCLTELGQKTLDRYR